MINVQDLVKNDYDWKKCEINIERKILCKDLLRDDIWICANVSNNKYFVVDIIFNDCRMK